MNDIYDRQVIDILTPSTIGHTRGHSQKLFLKHAKLNLRKNFYGLRAVAPWNDLPEVVVKEPSVKAFEGRLDKWWEKKDVKFQYRAEILKGRKIREAEELDIEAELT